MCAAGCHRAALTRRQALLLRALLLQAEAQLACEKVLPLIDAQQEPFGAGRRTALLRLAICPRACTGVSESCISVRALALA